ncbi:MAG: extracellular solute-binding protein [Clostridiaceae bacterium]|nr:extracellular solute-binding protein [Clostridiaceae bacterium]
MMKKKFARVMSMLLVSGMLFSVAACNSGKKGKVVKISEDDPYFSAKTVVLYQPESTSDQVSITNMVDLGDKFAVVMDIYLGSGIEMMYSGDVITKSVEIDGEMVDMEIINSPETTDIDNEDTDVAADQEGDEDVEEGTDEEIIDDGLSEEGTDEEIIDDGMSEEDFEDYYEDEYYEDDWSQYQKKILVFFDYDGNKLSEIDISDMMNDPNAYFTSMTKDGKGNLLLCFDQSEYTNNTYKSSLLLKTIDKDGNPVGEDITIENKENEYIYSAIMDGNGHIVAQKDGQNGSVLGVYDLTGKFLFDIKPEGDYPYIQGIYPINGELYVSIYSEKVGVYKVDFEAQKFGAKIDAPNLLFYTPVITDNGLFINKPSGVYSYDLTTGKEEQIMSWNDTDISITTASQSSMLPVSKDKILLSELYYYGPMSYYGGVPDLDAEIEPLTLTVLTREAKNPHAGKTIMTLGGLDIGYDDALAKQILEFNKVDEKYRIEIQDYSDRLDMSLVMSEDEDGYLKALNDLNQKIYLDIVNGDGPDILYSSYYSANMDRYVAKGLLVDFYDIAKDDADFAKEDFLPNILSAYEVNGKLYEMPTGFYMTGWVGPERLIGSRSGWTFEEFNQFVDGLSSDTVVFANRTQKDMLSSLLNASLGKFLDYDKSQANFSNEEFYGILELAKQLGTPLTQDELYSDENYVDEYALMSSGKLALQDAYVFSPMGVAESKSYFAEPVTFVGYPSEEKSGLMCSSSGTFSIVSTSGSQDGAWRFIKSMVGADYQDSYAKNGYGIPVRISSFEKQIELVKKQAEDMNNGEFYYGMGSYELTDEDIEFYREIVANATVRGQIDEQILGIINEEAPAFFSGQKTAQDVAAILDNRVKTILSERS